MERCAVLEHGVRAREGIGEPLHLDVGAVGGRMHVGEVDHRTHPLDTLGDPEDVVEAPEIADTAHHLDAEGDRAALALQPLAERAELVHDRRERVLALAAEEEAGVEDDKLGARSHRDARGVVEHARGHVVLLVALEVAHEAGDRRVDGERDVVLPGELAEALGPRVVHPELALEVDLAGVVAPLEEQRHGLLGAFARGNAGRADAGLRHAA